MAADEKAQGKVEIKIGNLSFSAEGEQHWLSEQLSKVIKAASPVMAAQGDSSHAQPKGNANSGTPTVSFNASLSSYLKAKGGENKQVQRFLATAGWLFRRGTKELTSNMVAAALAEHHQKRLSNPADCLNQNCSKGYCEKRKDHFFITPEGWKALGEAQ